ncbi:MAG: cytochrome C oxidase subunit IV family protein [Bdellovibrionota bacterium]
MGSGGHGTGGHGHTAGRLGDGTLAGQDFEPGLGHTIELSVLRNVLLTLLFLTVVTVAASRVDFGHWNMVIAIVIASIKAAIVATFFMHLKFEGKTILMYVVYPLMILFLLVGGSFVDISERTKILPATTPANLPQPKVMGPNVGHEGAHVGSAPAAGHGTEASPAEHH